MKFNSMRYNFENVFQREISQIAQLFGKLRNLKPNGTQPLAYHKIDIVLATASVNCPAIH